MCSNPRLDTGQSGGSVRNIRSVHSIPSIISRVDLSLPQKQKGIYVCPFPRLSRSRITHIKFILIPIKCSGTGTYPSATTPPHPPASYNLRLALKVICTRHPVAFRPVGRRQRQYGIPCFSPPGVRVCHPTELLPLRRTNRVKSASLNNRWVHHWRLSLRCWRIRRVIRERYLRTKDIDLLNGESLCRGFRGTWMSKLLSV